MASDVINQDSCIRIRSLWEQWSKVGHPNSGGSGLIAGAEIKVRMAGGKWGWVRKYGWGSVLTSKTPWDGRAGPKGSQVQWKFWAASFSRSMLKKQNFFQWNIKSAFVYLFCQVCLLTCPFVIHTVAWMISCQRSTCVFFLNIEETVRKKKWHPCSIQRVTSLGRFLLHVMI